MQASVPSAQGTPITATCLLKPIEKETLYLYLAVTEVAASAVLVRLEDFVQKVIYYVSKRLVDVKSRYPAIEKLVYSLVLASKKAQPYFEAHPIIVYTDQPLRQVLQKPEAAGKLLKWALELS